MNFLEAYEANKTKRVRMKQTPERLYPWKAIGLMKDQVFDSDEIEAEWEVEKTPEVYTVVCEWKRDEPYGITYPYLFTNSVNLHHLTGKRTKLTIEVLE